MSGVDEMIRDVRHELPDECVAIWVDRVDYSGGTVAFARGHDENGERVDFWGEPRALHAIAEAIENGDGPVLAAVAWWSIVRRPPVVREVQP